jgi:glutamate--cysteine ligase catalytic subunit
VVAFDDAGREVKLSLRQADILEALANDPELIEQGGGVPDLARGEEKSVEASCTFARISLTGME